MNSGVIESSVETDNDAPARLTVPDTQGDAEPQTGVMPTDPGPFQDIPQSIWMIFLSAWALLFTLFILFFSTTLAAAFVVTVAALFGLMAFGLPVVIAAQARCERHECGGTVHTRTGPLSAAAAGTQIVLIPVAAVIGLLAFIAFAV